MLQDDLNEYRPLLEDDPPAFVDRVDTPWDHVPDLDSYNDAAYRRIDRDLARIRRDSVRRRIKKDVAPASSRGVLVLGEAGTGKTHLLMRLAQKLSDTNHILFVRKPNNEEAVAQHIWANIVNSLTRTLPSGKRSQIDDLLAHVFSEVLIPEFEKDIDEGTNVEQRQRWINQLREDPYNLFSMLGEGESRSTNMQKIRRRTLRFLQTNQPDVDRRIAHALITYCFVAREDRKRVLLTWLSGQDIDPVDAQSMGLPETWVDVDETSTDASTQQQREEQALRAIQSLGLLSTHYQPLILAFDQLEGLRDEHRLTHRWGDVTKEIFTMTPNLLIVTCIFPTLWESWFSKVLDEAAQQRISQRVIELEKFGPQHATALLQTHLREHFSRYRLPTDIYPFTDDDVGHLCFESGSPRVFLQKARSLFETWLDGEEDLGDLSLRIDTPSVVTQDSIDAALTEAYERFESEQRREWGTEIPIEQDFFGRIRNLTQTVLTHSGEKAKYDKARCDHYVMPPNFTVKSSADDDALCIAIMNSVGNAFAARIRNLKRTFESGDQFRNLIIIRDRRCKQVGPKSQEYLEEVQENGGTYILAGVDEITSLNGMYDTMVAVEEHDLSVGSHEIDKRQLVEFLRNAGVCERTQLFRNGGRFANSIARATASTSARIPSSVTATKPQHGKASKGPATPRDSVPVASDQKQTNDGPVDVVIGDTESDSKHLGVLGELKGDQRKLGISLTKPQCIVVLGYMGSGKSYSLGVLMENALLGTNEVIRQTRPMSVVAFNYRRNPESRFEYAGFTNPNSNASEVKKLRQRYGADPDSVQAVNVFGYGPELTRRRDDYGAIPTFPIQFRSDELGAEHWEILMKPPTPQSEYMDVIRDIIQKLFYEDRLTFKTLEKQIQTDKRLSEAQRRRAMNRMSFAERWISDDRGYDWSDVLDEGTLNIFDLRMQTMDSSEALKLCLVVTDLIRRTRNGVNKMIVFDEAHEYVDCKELVAELENSITQIRHDGLSFVLASQFPERIPERIFKYLLTRLIFKLPTKKAISYVRKAAPNLDTLSPDRVANLDLEQGVCFVQTDDDCSDPLLKSPTLLEVRPRCTQHGGATIRQVAEAGDGVKPDAAEADSLVDVDFEEEVELCPRCGKELTLRRSKEGPVMVCSGYPTCRFGRRL